MDSLPSELHYQFAGVPAFGTVVFNQTPRPAPGATITVNGVALVFDTDFSMGIGSNQAYSAVLVARRFAEKINGVSDDSRFSLNRIPHKDVFARVFAQTVILYSRVPGAAGNGLTLATSNSGAFTISGGFFSGGSNGNAIVAVGNQSVNHNEVLLSANTQVIPVGAKGWTATVITGTGTFGSAAGLPAGFSDSDTGTLGNTLTITAAAASTVYVRWNT